MPRRVAEEVRETILDFPTCDTLFAIFKNLQIFSSRNSIMSFKVLPKNTINRLCEWVAFAMDKWVQIQWLQNKTNEVEVYVNKLATLKNR